MPSISDGGIVRGLLGAESSRTCLRLKGKPGSKGQRVRITVAQYNAAVYV
jgi:hypothetical protein